MSTRSRVWPWWLYGCRGCGERISLVTPFRAIDAGYCNACDREMERFRVACAAIAHERLMLAHYNTHPLDRFAEIKFGRTVYLRGPRSFPVMGGEAR